MNKNKNGIAVSSLYTAATWVWGAIPCAHFVTPKEALPIFKFVNFYMALYRKLNPAKFSLKHQLLHRHAAIDKLLHDNQCKRIVEIACGFSPRGSQLSARADIDYTEMDLPEVTRAKRLQLAQSAEGRAVLARANFHLKVGDITRINFVAAFASRKSKPAEKIAIVTEGLMMYFTREQQMPIWKNIAALLKQTGGIYLFDYIPLCDEPPRSRLGDFLHRLRTRVFKMKPGFAYDNRSRNDIADDLKAAGFPCVEAIDTGHISQAWQFPQAEEPTRTIIYCCRADLPAAPSVTQQDAEITFLNTAKGVHV